MYQLPEAQLQLTNFHMHGIDTEHSSVYSYLYVIMLCNYVYSRGNHQLSLVRRLLNSRMIFNISKYVTGSAKRGLIAFQNS